MKLIADVGNPSYYETRAIELISNARSSSDYRTLLTQAIGLLALSVVTRENGT